MPYDELYVNQHQSAGTLATYFGCHKSVVLRNLKSYSIQVRPSGGSPERQYVPPQVYTTITSDLAYALGLIASDGCLPKGDSRISLPSTDIELIELFTGCLQLDPSIEPYIEEAKGNLKKKYTLNFSDRRFRAFLESVGLTPTNSKTLGPLIIPDQVFADFCRGAWDGDGDWTIDRRHNYLNTELASGSRVYLEWMQVNIERLAGLRGHINSIYLRYCGRQAVAIGKWMYYAASLPALSRKREIWQRFAADKIEEAECK